MFTIGDFARHGRVSVRMLRHYDAIGLLTPARVDPVSGYRSYAAGQLARLNRIIALKDLGFTLQQVRAIVADEIGLAELHGMLRLRRAELEAVREATEARLAQVGARLRSIESEGTMSTQDVVIKRIPAVRVAELSATADSYEPQDIGPVITPLFTELFRLLGEAGVTPSGPPIAYYEDALGGSGAMVVHAAAPVATEPGGEHRFQVVELPAVESAATIVHRGSMAEVMPTAQTLARWIDANGHRSAGYARELYLECPQDQALWVTELQEPVTRA